MTSPLMILDRYLNDVIVQANKVRQVRDRIPRGIWLLVPYIVREPIDRLFDLIERYDRFVGQMQQLDKK